MDLVFKKVVYYWAEKKSDFLCKWKVIYEYESHSGQLGEAIVCTMNCIFLREFPNF